MNDVKLEKLNNDSEIGNSMFCGSCYVRGVHSACHVVVLASQTASL